MELCVTIADSWKLLTSVSSSLDPPWLNYDIQRAEEDCSNVNSLLDGDRILFVFIRNPKCNQDFNETILETLSISEKALKMLLNILNNVNAATTSKSFTNFCVSYQETPQDDCLYKFRVFKKDASTLLAGKMPIQEKK